MTFARTWLAASVVFSLCALPAMAGNTNNNTNNKNNNNNKNTNNTNTTVDRSASIKAQQDIRTAETELQKASTALAAAAANARKEFDASSEFKSANETLKLCQTEFDAVRKPILDALLQKPEYQGAKAVKEKAEAEKEAVFKDPTSTPEQRLAAANAVLAASSVLSRMEAEALAADGKYADAKAKLTEANAKVSAMIKEFEASLKNNAQFTSAKTTYDAAKTKLETAKKDLQTALQNEAQAANTNKNTNKNNNYKNANNKNTNYKNTNRQGG